MIELKHTSFPLAFALLSASVSYSINISDSISMIVLVLSLPNNEFEEILFSDEKSSSICLGVRFKSLRTGLRDMERFYPLIGSHGFSRLYAKHIRRKTGMND